MIFYKLCASCGDPFIAERPAAKYCSDKCRTRACRARAAERLLSPDELSAKRRGNAEARWAGMRKPCGTEAAYSRHLRKGETPCDACIEAAREARKNRAPSGGKTDQCSRCSKTVRRHRTSAREIICHECRRKDPVTASRYRDAACEQCGKSIRSQRNTSSLTGWTRYCSRACVALAGGWTPGGRVRRWADRSEEARHRKRQKARARHRNRQLTGDGVTDKQILERDRWMCRMDKCIYGSRRINPKRKYPDQRSASIDHILPLSLGGDDTQYNKRAAHLGCNMARGQGRPGEQLPMAFGLDPDLVLEPRWAKKARQCSICNEPINNKRCMLHMPVHYFTCPVCQCLFVHKKQGRIYCSVKCSNSAHHDRKIKTMPAHLRGLEAKAMRDAGMGLDEIAIELGYSGAPYAAAAIARATGQRSSRRAEPYVRPPRVAS